MIDKCRELGIQVGELLLDWQLSFCHVKVTLQEAGPPDLTPKTGNLAQLGHHRQ